MKPNSIGTMISVVGTILLFLAVTAAWIVSASPLSAQEAPVERASTPAISDGTSSPTAPERSPVASQPRTLIGLEEAFASIEPTNVYKTCKWLAAPPFAGRYPGTAEYTEVCRALERRFESWGLRPGAAGNAYLQPYPSPYTIIDEAAMTLILPEASADEQTPAEPAVEGVTLEAGVDFLPLLYCDSGAVTAEIVFVGWGICAPELGYDDYAGVDVEDKLVLCFRGTPDRAQAGFTAHDHHRRRMAQAEEKGARGLIYIYDEVNANPNGDRIEGFMPVAITEAAADRIFALHGRTAQDLRRELGRTKQPGSFTTGARTTLEVAARHIPDGEAYNVLAWVEGAHPVLKREFVVIGAHLDHCGRHMGLLFPGANDNASGSACVIEIARAFSTLEKPPKRSVMFALFGSEERGVLGSAFLVDHLPPVIERISAMLNMDMVGEGDGTGAAYSQGIDALKKALELADQKVGTLRRVRELRSVGVRSGDFGPFFMAGVPCITFWSNGPHLHYHQTGDTIYRINPDMLADMSKLVFLSAYSIADLR